MRRSIVTPHVQTLAILGTLVLAGCDIVDGGIVDVDGSCVDPAVSPQEEKLSIEQGIWGQLEFWEGNFVPEVECPSGTIRGVERTVLVFEATPDYRVVPAAQDDFFSEVQTQLVDSVRSDASGFFQVALEPGEYSVFVREGSLLYAHSWDDSDVVTVLVQRASPTLLKLDIIYAATTPY